MVGDIVTANVTIVATNNENLTCEAFNEAAKGSLHKTIDIKVVTPTTTSVTTTTIQPSTTPWLKTSRPRMLASAARRRQELYDRPVADMPVEDENEYDYSHFSYLNDQFEETYKETLEYAQEYYEDEYDYNIPDNINLNL